MQNGDTPAAGDSAPKTPEEVTKQSIRTKVWRHLESSGLAMFPRPVYNRIPNFKGAPEAAAKLAELDVFKNAATVKVNPDKPQEDVRVLCLENSKALYVPVPRLQARFLNRLEVPEGSDAAAIRKAVSRNGMETYGKPVALEENVAMDLVVMGSVAVSKEGYRIGKGKGYGDLEFGLMMHMKAIKPSTVVVTTVHDSQVFDSFPAELFGPHDVPVDIIVTPTQVIETQRMSQRPAGVLWQLLSSRRLSLTPALAQLRDVEMLAGRACPLKEVDTDVEERAHSTRRRLRRRTRDRKSQSEGEGAAPEGESADGKRRPRRRSAKSAAKDAAGRDERPRRRKPRPEIDFSLKISNISPETRVRELKAALSERGVKPQTMVWKGYRGFCYLHFFKTGPQKGEGDAAPAPSMSAVLEQLAALELGADDTRRALAVEPAPPRATPEELALKKLGEPADAPPPPAAAV